MDTDPTNFDPGPCLIRDSLALFEIFALMRGENTTLPPGPSEEQYALYQAVKIVIDDGILPAIRRENGKAYLRTVIKFTDAVKFVRSRESDPVWNPPGAPDHLSFYRFIKKWSDYRGVDWDKVTSDHISKVGAVTECRAWLSGLMKNGQKQKTKTGYRDEANEKYKGRLSQRGFLTAWDGAIAENPTCGWSKTGPLTSS